MAEASIVDATNRGRPSDPELQGRFLQAALDLLAEKGYRALTTAAIAKRAGASTASLYRRWPTKQALVADLARSLTLDALADIDTGTLEGDLREFIRRKRTLLGRVGTPLLVLLAEAVNDAELRDILREVVVDETARYLATVLDRAGESGGHLAADALHVLTRVIIGGELVAHALPAPAAPMSGADPLELEVDMIMRLVTPRDTGDGDH